MLYPVELWDRIRDLVRQTADEFKIRCYDILGHMGIRRQMTGRGLGRIPQPIGKCDLWFKLSPQQPSLVSPQNVTRGLTVAIGQAA